MTSTLRIATAEATDDNLNAVLRLIRQASDWLSDKGTDQWARPWPCEEMRDARVWRGLMVGATWIVWAGTRAVATVTIAKTANVAVWKTAQCDLDEPAVYAHRLIVDRQFAGWGLGAELSDWTGLRAYREFGARWIRVDVWTSNVALHGYYMKRGFEPCGLAPDPCYPSGALFQKPVSDICEPFTPLLTELKPAPDPFEGSPPCASPGGPRFRWSRSARMSTR